jgi:1A family penicillin-binding protein
MGPGAPPDPPYDPATWAADQLRRLRSRARDRPRAFRLLAGVAALAAVTTVAVAGWAWHTVAGLDLGRVQDATIVYAAGQRIVPGLSLEATDLAGTLRRLGYQETAGPPAAPGQYRRQPRTWQVHLRAHPAPEGIQPARPVWVSVEDGVVTHLEAGDGEALDQVELEPEVLTGLGEGAGQLRHRVRLDALPRHLVAAVLAAEDHRFYGHPGVDPRAVLRALWVNLRRSEVAQGGSTLTQQLVKNQLLTPRRTFGRKAREVVLALALERRYAKTEILDAYLNGVYLGQHGGLAIHGVGAAARSYFGKDAERLTLAESALLAALIRAPNATSPFQHEDRARARRDLVLRRLEALGWVDARAAASAAREPLRLTRAAPPRLRAPYFVDTVRAEAEEGADGPQAAGLSIYTSLDPVLQRAAEAAVARGLDRLEGQFRQLRRREPAARLQGALVALDPRSGEIRALVGGRDYAQSQWNRATQARRQPGSAFKPFVYLAALGAGPRGEAPHFTALSRVEDRPLTVGTGPAAWSPRNYESRYEGTVTIRRALEQSLNAATVWIAESIGSDAVVHAARAAGITSPLAAVPALALGGLEVTPVELAGAYAPFANGGVRVVPHAVRVAVDRGGARVGRAAPAPAPAVAPEEAFLVTHLLTGVVEQGTGATARTLGVVGPVAGKTGTTNEGRDAWFVGYTPGLVALVWVGFDERDVMRLSGAQAALPIWADFMRVAMTVAPGGPFIPPETVTFRDVDPGTGKLAGTWCPLRVREAFLAGTEPREACTDHGPTDLFRSFFRRFF